MRWSTEQPLRADERIVHNRHGAASTRAASIGTLEPYIFCAVELATGYPSGDLLRLVDQPDPERRAALLNKACVPLLVGAVSPSEVNSDHSIAFSAHSQRVRGRRIAGRTRLAWCIAVFERPTRVERQEGNRWLFRRPVAALGGRDLRVIALEGRIVIRNTFSDRAFEA